MYELMQSRTVSVELKSTHPAHLGFELRGTLVPRPLYPNLFDGEFTFKHAEGAQHVGLIVQNRGYEWVTSGDYGEQLVQHGCLQPAQVPPLHELRSALARARSSASGASLLFPFAGDVYEATKTGASLHISSSRGVTIQLTMQSELSVPTPDFVSKVQDLPPCPSLFTTTAATTEALASETTDFELVEEECPCTSPETKKCLFVHGIGVHQNLGLQDAYPSYWGNIERMLPCCADVKFTHFDSVDTPWYDELFAERVCDAMLAVSRNESLTLANSTRRPRLKQPPPVVENTVVVTHSTGNLYLASALMYKKCRLDRQTSKWIAIEGPMRGSNTANRVLDECTKPADARDALMQTVVKDFELCPVKNSSRSLVVANSNGSCRCLDDLYATADAVFNDHVYASLCGVSPFGLTSTSSAKFVALAKFSNHSSSNNDGVVELESCATPSEDYKPTYRNRTRFYRASINHDDGRLVHGDGLWGDDRKPVKWLQCQF